MKKIKIIIICQTNVNISKLYTTFMMKVAVYYAFCTDYMLLPFNRSSVEGLKLSQSTLRV